MIRVMLKIGAVWKDAINVYIINSYAKEINYIEWLPKQSLPQAWKVKEEKWKQYINQFIK